MAAKPKTSVKAAGNTTVAQQQDWKAEMAAAAEATKKKEAHVGGGNIVSAKGGVLRFNGADMPGNKVIVILADYIFENVLYLGKYDPDEPTPPACFAIGKTDAELAPHESVVLTQAEACDGCPMNEWDSNPNGAGKACKNTRRLALVYAGQFDEEDNPILVEDDSELASSEFAFMKLPVTSIKGFAAYVKQVANVHGRPPWGVLTTIEVIKDDRTQFRVSFTCLGLVPDELMPVAMDRHKAAYAELNVPYPEVLQEVPVEKPRKAAPVVAGKKPSGKKF